MSNDFDKYLFEGRPGLLREEAETMVCLRRDHGMDLPDAPSSPDVDDAGMAMAIGSRDPVDS